MTATAAAACLVMMFLVGATAISGSPASAAPSRPHVALDDETSTTIPLEEQPLEAPSMLPRPNTGVAPQSPYDRGGIGQVAVFFGLVASLVILWSLYRRDVRRATRRRAAASGDGGEDA